MNLRVRHAGADPEHAVRRPTTRPARRPGSGRAARRAAPVEVQLDHHVGAARRSARVRVLRLRGERLGPGRRPQEVHRHHAPGRRRPRPRAPCPRSARTAGRRRRTPRSGLSRPNGARSTRKWCLFGSVSRTSTTSGTACRGPGRPSRTGSAAATGCRCRRTPHQRRADGVVGRLPVDSAAPRTATRAATAVARIRSSVSGSVVYRSLTKPRNSESVELSSTRSFRPDPTWCPRRRGSPSSVRVSPPAAGEGVVAQPLPGVLLDAHRRPVDGVAGSRRSAGPAAARTPRSSRCRARGRTRRRCSSGCRSAARRCCRRSGGPPPCRRTARR